MDRLRIRRAGLADAGTVVDLVAALLSELTDGRNEPPRPVMLAVAEGLLGDGSGHAAFLAEDAAGRAIGVVTVAESASIHTLGRFGVIAELFVVPELRSKSVGCRLVRAVIDHGRRHGWTRVEVGAPSAIEWPDSVRFYEREGFIEIGPRLKYKLG